MRRDDIDFHAVAWEHRQIDARLTSWARWVKGGSRVGGACAPMFRACRSGDKWSGHAPVSSGAMPDELDGLAVEHAVRALPEGPREAVRWSYVTPYVPPWKVSKYLDVPLSSLPGLVHEARALLCEVLRRGRDCAI